MAAYFFGRLGGTALARFKLAFASPTTKDATVGFIASTSTVRALALEATVDVAFIASASTVYSATLDLQVPFIGSASAVYAPSVQGDLIVPFAASATSLYAPIIEGTEVFVPFIASHTAVRGIAAVWREQTGPGNGGETTLIQLAPAGAPVTVQLAAAMTESSTTVVFDAPISGLLADTAFLVAVDDEVILVQSLSLDGLTGGALRRGRSNTVAGAHAVGVDATWTDSYDLAVASTGAIAAVTAEGYLAFLTVLDCTQAYFGGDRYATHAEQLLGVFAAGDNLVSKLDSPQPSSVSAIDGVSERVPVGLTVPALLTDDVVAGDVALCRYRNLEASAPLVLGPRSVLVQTWYAFNRVDATNNNVTLTNPAGNIVDGTTAATFADSSTLITAFLDADDRYFTNPTRGYGDKAILMSGLSVRQGHKRIPLWTSPDWHNFDWVFCGFGDDCNYVQIIARRKNVPVPGDDDVYGPNATWDDPDYPTSTAWHVVLTSHDEIIIGPSFNGTPVTTPPVDQPPDIITVPGGGSGTSGTGGTVGDPDEGGSGGGISPGFAAVGVFLETAHVSAGFGNAHLASA